MSDDSEVGDDVESENNGSFAQNDIVIRRSRCRYGSGCTHIFDPSHRDRFWHPSAPKLNNEQLKSQFICNECGYATSQLKVLQVHLQRKTAWSNTSLIGCRINCLVDLKEWHEGFVLQFHKSGKHYVEFRQVNEKRWLVMKKIAFYILERPASEGKEESEFKEDEIEGLAPVENNWVYCENISLDYTFAQSVLFKIYGNSIQETGHLTKGHTCLTDADRLNAQYVKGSLLYGELLPRGANKAFGCDRLNTSSASVLFDLGMGTGKILIQAFLQFKNLRYIFGIELSAGRYKLAEEALMRMVRLLGEDNYHVQVNPGRFIIVTEVVRVNDEGNSSTGIGSGGNGTSGSGKEEKSEDGDSVNGKVDPPEEVYMERVLHLQCGNMFDVKNINSADVVMMETDIPSDQHGRLQGLLSQMKPEARVLTYLDLRRIWQNNHALFRQLEVNRHQADRYPTSWSVQRGHHFYLWSKVSAFSEQPSGSNKSNTSWLPQLHHPNTIPNVHKAHNNSSSAAGGPSESPIAFSNSPHRHNISTHPNQQANSNNSHHTPHKNNSTEIDEQAGCMPWQWWFAFRGQRQDRANAKIVKKAISVADYERSINQQSANQRCVSPTSPHNTTLQENNTAHNAATNDVLIASALQIEPLSIPSRQRNTQGSSKDTNLNSSNIGKTSDSGYGHGGSAFSLSPRSGRVSPQLSPTISITPDNLLNTATYTTNINNGTNTYTRHTTHNTSPVHQQETELPLLSVDEMQFGSNRHGSNSTSKRKDKHRNKEATAGTESVKDSAKSKSPREPRESKRKLKDKSEKSEKSVRSPHASGGADVSNHSSPRSRHADKNSNPVTPRNASLPAHSPSSPSSGPSALEDLNLAMPSMELVVPSVSPAVPGSHLSTSEIPPSSPVASLSQRDASCVYLQHSAAMGAIDGMHSAQPSPHLNTHTSTTTTIQLHTASSNNNTTIPHTPNGSDTGITPSNSANAKASKSRSHKSKHADSPSFSPSCSPHTPPGVSLEANLWHDTHPSGANKAVHYVAQNLISAETITGQASAGARVLVQQMNAYAPALLESEPHSSRNKSKKGESGKSSRNSNIVDYHTSGKPRSYRINNTIPVRAHSPGEQLANNSNNNNTHSASGTGYVTTAALPVRNEGNRAHSNVHKPADGCTLM